MSLRPQGMWIAGACFVFCLSAMGAEAGSGRPEAAPIASPADLANILLGVVTNAPPPAPVVPNVDEARRRLVEVELLVKSNEVQQVAVHQRIVSMKQSAMKDNPEVTRRLAEIGAMKKEQMAILDGRPGVAGKAAAVKDVSREHEELAARFQKRFERLKAARTERGMGEGDPEKLDKEIALLDADVRDMESKLKAIPAEKDKAAKALAESRRQVAKEDLEYRRIEDEIQGKTRELHDVVLSGEPGLRDMSHAYEERQSLLKSLYAERKGLRKIIEDAHADEKPTTAAANAEANL